MHSGLCWEKPERKRILGKPRRRYEGNNKIDLKEIGSVSVNWINLAQNVSLSNLNFRVLLQSQWNSPLS
jgi:hypothetical protein